MRARTFRSLRERHFLGFFIGLFVSTAGAFIQTLALGWYVLEETGSSVALGAIATAQYLPIPLFGAIGGVLADTANRRRLYLTTQALGAAQAGALTVLTFVGVSVGWHLYALAFALGTITAIDHPTRQTLVYDIVGPEHAANAISLTAAALNVSRILGPAIGGILLTATGEVWVCFAVNTASYAAAIASVLAIPSSSHHLERLPRSRGQAIDGLRYVARNRELSSTVVLVAIVCGLGWSFDVVLPLKADDLAAGPGGLATMVSAFGVGAIAGGIVAAGMTTITDRSLLVAAGILGAAMAIGAPATSLWVIAVVLAVAGAAGMGLISLANSRVVLAADGAMRGRVMACMTLAVMGTRPIVATVAGFVGERFGVEAAIASSAGGILLVAVPVWAWMRAEPA